MSWYIESKNAKAPEDSRQSNWDLRRGDVIIIAEALLLLPAIQLAVRVVGLKQTSEWAGRLIAARYRGSPPISKTTDIQRIAKLIRVTCRRWPFRATCLDRSLLTAALLYRRRITVTIRFGFRKHETEVKGHAWVEHNGLPLAEDEAVNLTWHRGIQESLGRTNIIFSRNQRRTAMKKAHAAARQSK